MGPPWAPAFVAAVVITVVAIPFLRRLALATGFVDHPVDHKSHSTPVPYLGGVALIGAVLVGMVLAARFGTQARVIVLGAVVLGGIGLLDDHRTVDPAIRFAVQVALAVLAVAVGLRVSATGVAAADVAITIVWIVGITNAFNLLDNMDGLAAGVAAAAATAVFLLAVPVDQIGSASVAAALAGACLGFLAYNHSPASIFMGDTGSLFLGFVLAVLTIEVNPALAPPASFAVPLILLALPVLDTVTVTLARLRRRRPVSSGGQDHLSHRLVSLGLSRGGVVLALVGVEVLLGALAVAGGRRVIPLWTAQGGALVMLVALSLVASRAQVYPERAVGLPRWVGLAAVAGVAGLALLSGPALVGMLRAQGLARDGATLAKRGLASVGQGHGDQAAADFRQAAALFHEARIRLGGPLASLGRAVPVVSSNLDASRVLVSTGEQLSAAGAHVLSIADVGQLRVRGGAVSLDELRRLAPGLADAARVLSSSHARLGGVTQPYLLPPIQRAVKDLRGRVDHQMEAAERAADAARLVPAILGGQGTRHYFLAFQNNAELRGTGGLIGNWGELVGEGGRLRLARFGRLQELNDAGKSRVLHAPQEFIDRYAGFDVAGAWQQVNVSPDFPTTARVISDLYPQSGGVPVDGVIAIDPQGLAAMLELSGPIQVAGWPEPITAANVVDVVLRGAYERFPVEERRAAFLGDVARRTVEVFTSVDVGTPASMARAFGQAVRSDHMFVYLKAADEEQLVRRVGADGAIPSVEGDTLTVVNQNLAANKVDFYLHRRIRYDVRLDASSQPATLRGRVAVTMRNDAPSSGLAEGVIGPYDKRFAAGENRTYLSVYAPFPGVGTTIDGQRATVVNQRELGRRVASTTVSIPARRSRTVQLDLNGRIRLSAGGWYRLDLGHQPLVVPDEVDVSVSVPHGWRIADTRGLRRVANGRAERSLRLDSTRTLWVRVERTGWSGFWQRVLHGG